MKHVPSESDARSLNKDETPIGDHLGLLHALPFPLAVFRKSDGCIVTANRHFYDTFRLSSDPIVPNMKPASDDHCSSLAPDRLMIDWVDGDHARLRMPGGDLSQIKANVVCCRYDDQDCWLVTAPFSADSAESNPIWETEPPVTYRDLVENLNDILYATDQNAVVTYISPNVTRLAGYAPTEVIGRNFVEFVHPDDLSQRMGKFLKILGGASEATEYRLFTKTGEVKWVRTSARPIMKDGQVAGVQGILVDITDRKMFEDALSRSEEKYRLVVQHAQDAIFVIQDDHIKFMNPSASEVIGCTWDTIADRPYMEFVYPDDREMILERYQKRLRGEKLSNHIVFRIINKNGEIRDVELNGVLISWEGKPALLNFLRDITVHNMMEAQLRNSQKMEALGTLAGGIAHNFNNLLMGIRGNTSLSLMGLAPSTGTRKHLERIDKLVDSGSKLTCQLLEYARGGSCEVGSVNLNLIVKESCETLKATKKQILIRYNLPHDLPCIKADKGQIEQVLLNLLINAADAMPKGGTISIDTACVRGDEIKKIASLSDDRSYVLLTVTDSGSGIPKIIQNRIFEPFFTTKGLERGTGLGLSTSYGIVKNHGGEITVESELNRGTRFLVYLPVDDGETEPTERDESNGLISGQGVVLLVDDDPEVLSTISRLLEHSGYQVLVAADGHVAREKYQEAWQRIDLVILDLIMPSIGGEDLFYRLKKINPKIKVLLSSGYGLAGQAEALLNDGCAGFIQKPYDIKLLSLKIKEILSVAKACDSGQPAES